MEAKVRGLDGEGQHIWIGLKGVSAFRYAEDFFPFLEMVYQNPDIGNTYFLVLEMVFDVAESEYLDFGEMFPQFFDVFHGDSLCLIFSSMAELEGAMPEYTNIFKFFSSKGG